MTAAASAGRAAGVVETSGARQPVGAAQHALARPEPASLADVLERVLDKGIVIAGDIRVNLVDVELLTIRVRLLVASVDRAREMGIDWWEHDPMLTSRAQQDEERRRRSTARSVAPPDGDGEADAGDGAAGGAPAGADAAGGGEADAGGGAGDD